MLVEIKSIEKDKVTVSKDGVVKNYTMEDFVIPHAKLGVADIKFNDAKKVSFISMQETEEPKNGQPTGQKGFGDDLITLEDLLSEAHKTFKDGFSIETKVISIDHENQAAVFKARVTVKDQQFEGHGDANKENCGTMVKIHWIRMAETRAIVRALRWATNNAKAAVEETEEATKD